MHQDLHTEGEMMKLLAIVTAAVAVGYTIGRARPWNTLDAWAEDQARFAGPWVQGGKGRQVLVLMAHSLTHPRHTWRAWRKISD